VTSLEKELREHKEQASSAKNKYSDWNSELGNRLRELREEKKTWIREAAVLRTAEKETQVRQPIFILLELYSHSRWACLLIGSVYCSRQTPW
jgi:chromosome segregation ATPase